jgi:hypothetical protein
MSQRPNLLPWFRGLLLIRDIRSTTWGSREVAARGPTASPRPGDAPTDRAGRLVELTPAARRPPLHPGSCGPRHRAQAAALHRWPDTGTGIGLIEARGRRRAQGMGLSLSHSPRASGGAASWETITAWCRRHGGGADGGMGSS